MVSFDYTVKDEVGIHARPAGLIVKEVKKFAGNDVIIKKGAKSAKAKSPMTIMGLGVKCGETVTVEVTGPDEVACAAALKAFFEANC